MSKKPDYTKSPALNFISAAADDLTEGAAPELTPAGTTAGTAAGPGSRAGSSKLPS